MVKKLPLLTALGATSLAGALLLLNTEGSTPAHATETAKCDNDAGLSLSPGFCATIFADHVGHGRQMAVAPDGTVYLNTWSSRLLQGKPKPDAGFLVALKDTTGDGKADKIARFGTTLAQGSIGGTGLTIYKGWLYAEQDDKIVRYKLTPGQMVPAGKAQTIVTGLPMSGDHAMKPIIIDKAGTLFVNVGSPSNVCEKVNRQPGSMGKDPCEELSTRAGIWAFSADKPNQKFSSAQRYATGIRNTGGMAFDADGRLFAMQHGRDQLAQNWPKLYTVDQGAELPAEELLRVEKGDNFGWPYCYYDGAQKKLVLAPEYGGDGGKKVGRCASKKGALVAFPAHFAPTGLAYYPGGAFPDVYRGGLFISFHGSWNRAPRPQDGYRVDFQPMADGMPSAPAIRFADGFAGPDRALGRPPHRPTGIVATPNALYISDDAGGRVWKIVYTGAMDMPLIAAKPAKINAQALEEHKQIVPPGFTAEQVALGDRIYRGIERNGTCLGCHGPDGKGTTIGPKLTGPDWLWAGDGSVKAIAKVIKDGVSAPKQYPSGMPARGGSPLSDSDVDAVAAYVWTLGHTN